jgi:hypothetical protein
LRIAPSNCGGETAALAYSSGPKPISESASSIPPMSLSTASRSESRTYGLGLGVGARG